MPTLTDAAGHSLTVELTGYRHFVAHDNDFDANWVQVKIHATDGTHEVSARAPAFLAWEIVELIDWLRGVPDGRARAGFCGYEPLLQFEYDPETPDAGITAFLSRAFLPPEVLRVDEWPLRLSVGLEHVRAFADELEAEARAYPVRVVQPRGYAAKVLVSRH